MKFLEPMIIAFSMYPKIPMPRIEWNKENMKYTMCFFPLIGVVTGAIIYLAGMFLDGNIFSKVQRNAKEHCRAWRRRRMGNVKATFA